MGSGLCAGGGNGLVQHNGPLETVGGGVTRKKRFICSGEVNPFPLSWLDLGHSACVKEKDTGYPCRKDRVRRLVVSDELPGLPGKESGRWKSEGANCYLQFGMEEATLEGVIGVWGERALHLKLLCWKEGAGLEVEIGAGENVRVRM